MSTPQELNRESAPPKRRVSRASWLPGAAWSLGTAWLALRLLFVSLTVGWVVSLLWLQPFRKPMFDIALASVLGAWAVILLVLKWAPGIVDSRAFRAIDVVLFNLCLAAVLAEGALRLVAYVSPSPLLAQDDLRASRLVRAQAAHQQPGKLRFGFPFNLRGHYDTDFVEPSPPVTLASIGDSFSVGVVPHHFHFTTVIERQLAERGEAVEVENFGFPAIGPYEYLHLLRTEVLPREPDRIAVNVFVGNDVVEAGRYRPEDRALRLWLERENVLLYQLPRRLIELRRVRAESRDDVAVGGIAGEAQAGRLRTVEEMIAAYPWLTDSTQEQPSFPLPGVYLHIESERAVQNCDPATADPTALFATLREMRRLAGDVPFVVHLLPDDFQVDDELWQDILDHTGRHDLIRDLPQQLIVPWLEEAGIPHLDLLPIFREQCGRQHGDRHCYHRWDSHFNARGNRVAGEAMADFLGGR